jgi:Sulfotransferase family
VLNPHTFLSTERWATPVLDRRVVRRRNRDEMALGAGVPSEEEFASCTMTGLSPYMGWCFPGDGAIYDRYLTFREVRESEVVRWEHALMTFLKKLTVRYGRPLVLKSPPHTARIRLLLGLFPDARFVHIRRDPYVVFRSTRHMIRAAQPHPPDLLGGPSPSSPKFGIHRCSSIAGPPAGADSSTAHPPFRTSPPPIRLAISWESDRAELPGYRPPSVAAPPGGSAIAST